MNFTLLKSLFFLFIFFFAADVNAIEKIEFDINGLKIGDKLTDEFFNNYCSKKNRGKKEIECKQKLKIDEIPVTAIYFYYDFSLISVLLTYNSDLYDDLVKAYKIKFRHFPDKNIEEPINLRTGVQYTNQKVLWVTTSGDFIIEKYSNSFHDGNAYLKSNEYVKYLEKKKNDSNDGILKRIFSKIFH